MVLGSFGLAPDDQVKQAQVILMMQEHSLALGAGDFAGRGSPAPSETAVGEAGPAVLQLSQHMGRSTASSHLLQGPSLAVLLVSQH